MVKKKKSSPKFSFNGELISERDTNVDSPLNINFEDSDHESEIDASETESISTNDEDHNFDSESNLTNDDVASESSSSDAQSDSRLKTSGNNKLSKERRHRISKQTKIHDDIFGESSKEMKSANVDLAKMFQCKVCKSIFSLQASYIDHMKWHPEVKVVNSENEQIVPEFESAGVNANRTCAVSTCKNPNNVKYFNFPKDKNLSKLWEERCKREGKLPATKFICEIHFEIDAFEEDKINKMLNKPQRKNLKKFAVPTLHLPTYDNNIAPIPAELVQKQSDFDKKKANVVNEMPKKPINRVHQKCVVPSCDGDDPSRYKLRLDWIDVCSINRDSINVNNAKICGKHFKKEDFHRNIKLELAGKPYKKILRPEAVPSLCIESSAKRPRLDNDDDLLEQTEDSFENISDNNVEVNDVPITNNECAKEDCPSPQDVNYFPFPNDLNRLKAWLDYCKQLKKGKEWMHAKLCGSHFMDKDFAWMEKETLDKAKRYVPDYSKLKPDAVPSKNTEKEILKTVLTKMDADDQIVFKKPSELPKRPPDSECKQRFQKRLIRNASPVKSKLNQPNLSSQSKKPCDCISKVKDLSIKNLNAQTIIFQQRKEIKRLNTKKHYNEYVNEVLRTKGLTKVERRCVMNPKQKYGVYSQEDVARAVVLRGISSKAFNSERTRNGLPIPSVRTQERWLSRIKCLPGFMNESVDMLKELNERSKLEHFNETVLTFDEVAISQRYEMELKTQKIYGNHKKLQVVMARGLVSP